MTSQRPAVLPGPAEALGALLGEPATGFRASASCHVCFRPLLPQSPPGPLGPSCEGAGPSHCVLGPWAPRTGGVSSHGVCRPQVSSRCVCTLCSDPDSPLTFSSTP